MTKKEQEKVSEAFNQYVINLICSKGARLTTKDDKPFGTSYPYVVATKLGDMLVNPLGTAIFCRFLDVERATEQLGTRNFKFNSYSGKYNCHVGQESPLEDRQREIDFHFRFIF